MLWIFIKTLLKHRNERLGFGYRRICFQNCKLHRIIGIGIDYSYYVSTENLKFSEEKCLLKIIMLNTIDWQQTREQVDDIKLWKNVVLKNCWMPENICDQIWIPLCYPSPSFLAVMKQEAFLRGGPRFSSIVRKRALSCMHNQRPFLLLFSTREWMRDACALSIPFTMDRWIWQQSQQF